MEKRKQEEMDPMLPPVRQPSIETMFLEHCMTFESLNVDSLLANPWSVEEITSSTTPATSSAAADPNPTPVHLQGSPTLSLPMPVHRKIVDKVWAKIRKEQLPLTTNVQAEEYYTPTLSLSPSDPYEMDALIDQMGTKGPTFGHLTSAAFGDHQSLQDGGGRVEMPDIAVLQQLKGESLFSSASMDEEGMEWERGGRGKKEMDETDEKEMERRMKKLIRSRESAARFHAKKQAYTRELEAKVNQLREENARLQEEQKIWARMSQLLHESMDEKARNDVCIPRRHNSCPWW